MFLLSFTVFGAGKGPDSKSNRPDFEDKVRRALGLRAGKIVQFQNKPNRGKRIGLEVRIKGKPEQIEMLPYSVRAGQFQVLSQQPDGTFVEAPAAEVKTFRGELRGKPGSFVAGSLTDEGLRMRILTEDGSEYWLEPVGRRLPGAQAGDHAFYSQEDVLGSGNACAAHAATKDALLGLAGSGDASGTASASGDTAAGGFLKVAEIACDADHEFYLRWGSVANVQNRIEEVINAVNVQYERDVAITHLITTILVRTAEPDPYTSTDPNTLLQEFRSHWGGNHTSIPRDVAHLFTGKNLDGSVVGIAWIGAICGNLAYGLSQSDYTSNFASVTDLTAHELGHNWGANHCSCSGYTMNPSITGGNRFSAASISVITSFRDSRGCLDDSATDVPVTPSGLAATAASDSRIDLSWNDSAANEQGYDVERSPDGVTWAVAASLGANANSHSDTGLNAETTYYYRVKAYNNVGDSGYSNVNSATTQAPPPPPAAPGQLTAAPVSDMAIDLAWVDASNNENGFRVERMTGSGWAHVVSLPIGAVTFRDTGLEATTAYTYRVFAFNQSGDSPASNTVSATTDAPPPFVDQFAATEFFGMGSVTGTFSLTHDDDGQAQSIRERMSGGKRSMRTSELEHTWQFQNVRAGQAVTVFAEAWSSDSPDGDTFQFEYSTDGSMYSPIFEVGFGTAASGDLEAFSLPSSIAGTVFIRVRDSDRSAGNQSLDTVSVDQLFIRTDLVVGNPPAAPGALNAVAESAGSIRVEWLDSAEDEYGFEVEASSDGVTWVLVGTAAADSSLFVDTSVPSGTTRLYRVRAYNGAGSSSWAGPAAATTPEGITAAAVGYKVKGTQQVELVWSGGSASSVYIYRDGQVLDLVPNDGFYLDAIGVKGGGIYDYEICEADGGGACSDVLTVVF